MCMKKIFWKTSGFVKGFVVAFCVFFSAVTAIIGFLVGLVTDDAIEADRKVRNNRRKVVDYSSIK